MSSQLFSENFVRNSEAATRCILKKMFLKILQYSQKKKHLHLDLFNKVADLKGLELKKETSTSLFSSEYFKIFKSTYFKRDLQVTASVNSRAAVFQESCFAF